MHLHRKKINNNKNIYQNSGFHVLCVGTSLERNEFLPTKMKEQGKCSGVESDAAAYK